MTNDIPKQGRSDIPQQGAETFDGIVLVDKPAGPTSHDVVAAIRRRFGFRKVGHGGTLDPQATGLLVILIGRGTGFADRFMGSDKTYAGCMRLGISTDTQDAQGKILEERDWTGVTRERLEEEMNKWRGDVYQTPPMVSAVKIDGVALYRRARRGEVVEREPRLIHIYEFRLTEFDPPRVHFHLRCTKGTYVRTICADIGEALGCGAHLESLRRLACGECRVEDALPLDSILSMDRETLRSHIIPAARLPISRSP
jgi:tRNA pseudouridine55 synthase